MDIFHKGGFVSMDKELCKELCKKMYGDYWAIKICIEKCKKGIKEI